jgi:hypothetical protein
MYRKGGGGSCLLCHVPSSFFPAANSDVHLDILEEYGSQLDVLELTLGYIQRGGVTCCASNWTLE